MAKSKEKKLGFPALTAMVIGSMVGAGIFMTPARFAGAAGVYGTLIAWVIAGTGMLMLAFVFQALAIRKPDLDAGVFAYAKAGFGDYAGFLTAIGFWASACAGNVTYLVLIKSTLGKVFPFFDTNGAFIFSSAIIWLFFMLISRGIQQATFINTIVTIGKIVPIVVFILVALFAFDTSIFTSNLQGTTEYAVSADTDYDLRHTHETDIAGNPAVPLFEQVSKTMLLTVFVFLGIEGASVYSRYAKTREMVGRATVLGFISVLCLLVLVSILPFGILSQEAIADLRQPSLAGVLEAILGVPGGVLISVGLLVSVSGAYLAWTLMAAEVLFAAAKEDDMPALAKKKNSHGVPIVALFVSALLTQVILLITIFSDRALDFALDLTSALALLPFLLTAGYALRIALSRDGYEDVAPATRTKELIFAAIATIYTIFLIIVAGLEFIPLSAILLAPATIFFVMARRGKGARIFTPVEIGIFIFLWLAVVVAVVGLTMGWITI